MIFKSEVMIVKLPTRGGEKEVKRMKRKTVWAYLDGKKLVDVVQAALDNNMTVDKMKRRLVEENPGHEVPYRCHLGRWGGGQGNKGGGNNSELDGMMKKQITIVVKMASFGSIDEVLKKFREIKKANPEEAFKMTIEIDLGDFSSLVLQHQLPSD